MPSFRPIAPLGLLLFCACQVYSPEPVDLAAHARSFAARLPNAAVVRSFATSLLEPPDAHGKLDVDDGISFGEARWIALVFHPECRLARARAGIALASAEHAGAWQDPVLAVDFERILESVRHPWLVAGSLGISLPLTGRPGLQKQLAESEHRESLLAARRAELHVLEQLATTWLQWSVAGQRVQLLADLCRRLDELTAIADKLASAQELSQMQARAFRLERAARGHELAVAEAAAARGELELKALLGLHPSAPVRFVPAIELPRSSSSASRRGISFEAVPRLQALQLAHDSAEHALALAIREQWPDLVLSPGYTEEQAQPRAALGIALPLPLLGGNAQAIARARAERALAAEALRCGYEQFVQDLALCEQHERETLAQRDAVTTTLLPLAAEQVEDGRRLAELGQLDTLLILDALVRAHESRQLALDTTLAAAMAKIATDALFWPEVTPVTAPKEEDRR